jgi:tetratricopeptide (TPR) repeat protein
LARLAVIATVTGKPDEAVAQLTRVLAQAPAPRDRAEILFALGGALDAMGRFDDAFHAVEAANWIAGALIPARYDRRQQENLVDSLISAYPALPARLARGHEPSGERARPLFICGMFRSGSTLAEQILGRHTAISAGGELELIPAIVRELQPYPAAATSLAPERLATLRANYLTELPGAGLVTDKRCDNFLHIGLIKTLFPEAKIIHTRRQPLDNLLSIYFLHFGDAVTYGHDLADATHFYLQYLRLMAHWTRLFPGEIFTLDYDRIVADARGEIARALTFLDLPWEENCLVASASSDAVRTASSWQVRQPLHARSSSRWRHYGRQLADARRMLADAGTASLTV